MEKLQKIQRGDWNTYFECVRDGFTFPLNPNQGVRYDSHISIDNKVLTDNESDPTIQDLLDNGTLVEKNFVTSVTIDCSEYIGVDGIAKKAIPFKDIQNKFKDKGIKVSILALKNLYNMWIGFHKSGYRGKGFHLFAPMSQFTITASKLDPHYKEWQKTYTC